jgi:hypothetical protein
LLRYNENQLQSVTAFGVSSNLPQVIYGVSARPNVPFRYIGVGELTNTTGAWAGSIKANYSLSAGSLKTNDIVGSVYSGNPTLVSTTATIPVDDTVPQLNEGGLFISAAYQAQSECNLINIRSFAQYSCSAIATNVMALFSGSNFNAIGVNANVSDAANYARYLIAAYKDRANNTNNVNYSMRMGTNGGTLSTSSANGARIFGGIIPMTYLEIQEIFT